MAVVKQKHTTLEMEQATPPPGHHKGVLHVCVQRLSLLELQLQEVHRSLGDLGTLGAAAMQQKVESQLLTCQEMFMEIEQKVASLSALSPNADQQDGLESSQQDDNVFLESKLDTLKAKLMSIHQLLTDSSAEQRRRHEQAESHCSSVQETFSSPRHKLLRQNSLQQQKELEHGLMEQKGLTQALARQGSRAQLHQEGEPDRPSPGDVPADCDGGPSQRTWSYLHSRLLCVEQRALLPPSQVTDSSDGTAGRGIVTKSLKELQTYSIRLRELGRSTEDLLNESSSMGGSNPILDEALFHVLFGAFLSLSSIVYLLHSQQEHTPQVEDPELRLQQIQRLSAEVSVLSREVSSQGSKVVNVLRREDGGQQCMDDLCRLASVLQAGLKNRETQLRKMMDTTAETERRLNQLHAAFTFDPVTNELSGNMRLEEQLKVCVQVNALLEKTDRNALPSALIHRADRLQGELDSVLADVGWRSADVRSSSELQQLRERLIHGLEDLILLGSERLRPAGSDLRSRAELQKELSNHTRFFRLVSQHFSALCYLTCEVVDVGPERWEGVIAGLQDDVSRLQLNGLDRGAAMQRTLQLWSQWEEDSVHSDLLLTDVETSFSKIPDEGNSEEGVLQRISVCKELSRKLQENTAQFSHMLEVGRCLQQAGCRGVGSSISKLETRWKVLQKRVEHEHTTCEKRRELRSRVLCDSTVLTDWMIEARKRIDSWTQLTVAPSDEMEAEQRRDLFLQSVALTKELEDKRELMVEVMGVSTRLEMLRATDEDQEIDPESDSVLLRQIESDWSSLMVDIPLVQGALQKHWMATQSQQEALQELQAWLTAAESQLEEQCGKINQKSCTGNDLSELLRFCKECQTDMSVRQIALDLANQSLKACSTDQSQRGRYHKLLFAEQQGDVNHQWLRLQENLRSQIGESEQQRKDHSQLHSQLHHINIWMKDQHMWMDSALKPCSRTELQRSSSMCKDLRERIRQRAAALQDLRENICSELLSHVEQSILDSAALQERSECVQQQLKETEVLWLSVKDIMDDLTMETLRTSQSLSNLSFPLFSVSAHRRVHSELQRLHKECEASEEKWDKLRQSIVALGECVCPSAVTVVNEQMDRQRQNWTAVCEALNLKLQQSLEVQLLWDSYFGHLDCFCKDLQMIKSKTLPLFKTNPEDILSEEPITEQIDTVKSLLMSTCNLHSDLERLLEASKLLIGRLEPTAAIVVESESRLLSRDFMQLNQQLSGRLTLLQEQQEWLQQCADDLQSLELTLQVWKKLVENEDAAADQSALLEPSGLFADLDVLNELSRGRTLSDTVASRLQRLNPCWAETSTRAEEACSALQTEALRTQSFEQKCSSWMSFLQRMEDSLSVDISGSYGGLRQQLCTHK
ncbi:nesprin-2-like, partial [Gouania willdenowi]|uniref:nesprin-2-like n=1 Tax=Gouania willdenowi TaxID=441366 RepID=UPI00105513D9